MQSGTHTDPCFLPAPIQIFARIADIFEVEPNKMCVASCSHAFATVSFTPQTMQTYQCIFEATVDGLPRYQLPSSPSSSRAAGHPLCEMSFLPC